MADIYKPLMVKLIYPEKTGLLSSKPMDESIQSFLNQNKIGKEQLVAIFPWADYSEGRSGSSMIVYTD